MTETVQKIKELDGKQLYYSFLAGAQRIFDHQKLLNKINVFPVADADTGTNLASTMRSIMDAIIPTENPKQTAVALADAALIGARGNSGIIFAQFLYGFSNEIRPNETLTVLSFAESVKKAVTYAYDAIADPVEGTILTVIKDWADYIYLLKDKFDDFSRLLVEAYSKALESLAATTGQLEVLARAHVVDAGAKGFVYWLEGFMDFFTMGAEKAMRRPLSIIDTTDEVVEMPHDEITFRFCTEALINGEHLDKHKIRNFIYHCGDSLVVAGTLQKVRVHIHTDFPAEVFSQLQTFGNITYQKVDDMVMQNEIQFNRKYDLALVTDSSCDLPKALIDKYQIHVVPLSVHFGETYFLDRLTINPPQFYAMQAKSEVNATSAQPASKEFQNKFEYLTTHYNSVIGIHLSQALSGTWSSSEKGSKDVMSRSGKKIDVVNSKTLTGGLGLMVLRAAMELENGTSHAELLNKIEDWKAKSIVRVSVTTMKYIVRSGRVSPFKGFIANKLDLKPVIAIDQDGKTFLFSKSFSEQGSMKKVIQDIARVTRDKKIWEYAITHANNASTAQWYALEMEKLTGKKPFFIEHASPALAANTGPGIACISLLLE
ncbi:MAG: DegV family protein [Bacteroidales bacterium]|nr:DegV family protein [Bacteroidales bacterium]